MDRTGADELAETLESLPPLLTAGAAWQVGRLHSMIASVLRNCDPADRTAEKLGEQLQDYIERVQQGAQLPR